jgi:hypothetical protein
MLGYKSLARECSCRQTIFAKLFWVPTVAVEHKAPFLGELAPLTMLPR